jgi:hypothetical protein
MAQASGERIAVSSMVSPSRSTTRPPGGRRCGMVSPRSIGGAGFRLARAAIDMECSAAMALSRILRYHTKLRPDLNGRRNACPEATICCEVTRGLAPRRPPCRLKPVGMARNFWLPLGRMVTPRSKASMTLGSFVKTSPAGRSDSPDFGKTCERQALATPRALPPKALVTC